MMLDLEPQQPTIVARARIRAAVVGADQCDAK